MKVTTCTVQLNAHFGGREGGREGETILAGNFKGYNMLCLFICLLVLQWTLYDLTTHRLSEWMVALSQLAPCRERERERERQTVRQTDREREMISHLFGYMILLCESMSAATVCIHLHMQLLLMYLYLIASGVFSLI